MFEYLSNLTEQSCHLLRVIIVTGVVKSEGQESNTNCLWGGGSCFLSTNENGEYSWVCYRMQLVLEKY